MRKIKFRAYDTFKQEWLDSREIAILLDGTLVAPMLNPNVWMVRNASDIELMQFTGLKDKNGKEIYAGDILKHPYKGIHAITWEDSEASFIVDGTYPNRMASGGEVVGNIYANPELIDAKE